MRVALVGCGYVSQFHLQGWQHVGAAVVTVVNPPRERAVSRVSAFGVRTTRVTPAEAPKQDSLDIVDIATSPETHPAIAEEAAHARKAVICQKPRALIFEAAREKLRLGRSLWRPFNGSWALAVSAVVSADQVTLGSGEIGIPHYLRIGSRVSAVIPDSKDWALLLRRQPYTASMDRLLLLEIGVHYIDPIRFLLGEFDRGTAEMTRVSALVTGEDVVTVLGRLEEGPIVVVNASWETVNGTRGLLEDLLTEGSLDTLKTAQGANRISVVTRAGAPLRRPTDQPRRPG